MKSVTGTLAVAFLLLAGARFSETQTVQGVVTGTIFDTSGAVVPNADVTLTNVGTNIAQNGKSGSDGQYRFALVPPGMYLVDVKAGGFAEKQVKDVKVDPSQEVPVNVTLAVASSVTTLQVEEAATLVQTATSDLATTVNQTTITTLPLLTRDVFNLAFAAPAVTQGMNFMAAAGGVRESGTTNMLNGSDNNDNFSEGSFNVTPPLESVNEFTVLANNMSAQYGHAAGALVSAIQKSGTNRFHGVAYEFNRNTDFNASTFFDNRAGNPNPKYIRNQFGGEVDGPIIRNKTFFMFTYDRLDLRQGTTVNQVVPTPSELAAITASAGPNAQYYLKTYNPLTSTRPLPCRGRECSGCRLVIWVASISTIPFLPVRTHTPGGSIIISAPRTGSVSTSIYRGTTTPTRWAAAIPRAVPLYPCVDNEHYHNLSLDETHLFSANLLNELTIAHNRHYSVLQAGNGQSANGEILVDLANYDGVTGQNTKTWGFGVYEGDLVQGFTQDRWQFQDNLTWTKGKHSFKFGGGFQYGILYRNWDLGSPGQYEFSNTLGATPAKRGAVGPNGTITNLSEPA